MGSDVSDYTKNQNEASEQKVILKRYNGLENEDHVKSNVKAKALIMWPRIITWLQAKFPSMVIPNTMDFSEDRERHSVTQSKEMRKGDGWYIKSIFKML